MREAGVYKILHRIGNGAAIVQKGQWCNMPCPLARWTHEKGKDKNPSFGVKLDDSGPSYWNCFVCGGGPLAYLVKKYEFYSGDITGMADEVEKEELFSLFSMGELKPEIFDYGQLLGTPLSDDSLSLYDEVTDHPYLRRREIDEITAKEIGLRLDYDERSEVERIIFPVFTHTGELYGFSGRAVVDGVEPKAKDYFGLPKKLLLLGSHLLTKKDPFIVLVEGLFDYARFRQYGYPVVAAMHARLTSAQAYILKEIGKPVIAFFDNDKAGYEGNGVVIDMLSKHVPVLEAEYPATRLHKGRSYKVKDPDELTYQQAKLAIENAEFR